MKWADSKNIALQRERERKKEREQAHIQIPAYAALNTSHAAASLQPCRSTSRIRSVVDAGCAADHLLLENTIKHHTLMHIFNMLDHSTSQAELREDALVARLFECWVKSGR